MTKYPFNSLGKSLFLLYIICCLLPSQCTRCICKSCNPFFPKKKKKNPTFCIQVCLVILIKKNYNKGMFGNIYLRLVYLFAHKIKSCFSFVFVRINFFILKIS